ncbi:MAG: branched-chain amino acid ABC transporter substrate-binding protein [Actinobacteria bacterium]|nr:branched-chain amino acid ABC transporter substrate-binding protein [Actinomycetota bacterium]
MKKLSIVAMLGVLAVLATAATGASSATNALQAPTGSAGLANALVTCGTTRTIGIAYPATGPAASIGQQQFRWAQFFQTRWNKAHPKDKVKFVQGDTKLPDTAAALAVAHQFASNSSILGLVGPAGSQEVQDTVAVFKSAGLAVVSGSATRVLLTRSVGGDQRETPAGYFFRTVPNDGQQGDRVASYIASKLKKKRVYIIDDQESYSQGLADQVESNLKAKSGYTVGRDHVAQTVSDFSSVITRIPSNTQIVYIPWQLPPKAQLFYTQLRAAGKTATVFGSDGTFAPGTFTGAGSYVSAFPVDFNSKEIKAYRAAHGGQDEAFGLPTYSAAIVNAMAIMKACKNGTASRAEVRTNVKNIKVPKAASLLGFPVQFLSKNKGKQQGPGDMGGTADFAIFKIGAGGKYTRVG